MLIPPAARSSVPRWPLALIAAPAAVAIWSGWVGLGSMAGFGVVSPLPGILSGWRLNTAITLPVGVEAYGAYALRAWLSPDAPTGAKKFAQRSAIGALALGMAGQVIYHLLSAAHATRAPWPVVVLVSCIPVVTLGFGAALAHLLRVPSDRSGDARKQGAPATSPGDSGAADMHQPVATARSAVTPDGQVTVAPGQATAADRPAPAIGGQPAADDRPALATNGQPVAAGGQAAPADRPVAVMAGQPVAGDGQEPAGDRPESAVNGQPATDGSQLAGRWHQPTADVEAAALAVLTGQPDITGTALGKAIGVSERTGRRLIARLGARAAVQAGAAEQPGHATDPASACSAPFPDGP